MNIEEKAKAYDEALERAKKLQKTCDSQAVVGWCEYIFPEIKESDDERIRKEIIDIIKSQKEQQCHIDGAIYDKMIAWLEKQGEHKILGIGVENAGGVLKECIDKIEQKERYMYSIVNAKSEGYNIGKKVEKSLMIDKACEWLETNLLNYWSQCNANNTKDFINDFKKAMEE